MSPLRLGNVGLEVILLPHSVNLVILSLVQLKGVPAVQLHVVLAVPVHVGSGEKPALIATYQIYVV